MALMTRAGLLLLLLITSVPVLMRWSPPTPSRRRSAPR